MFLILILIISLTAVMMAVAQLGSIGSFLEPLIVRSPGPSVTPEEIRSDVNILMYIGTYYRYLMRIASSAMFGDLLKTNL